MSGFVVSYRRSDAEGSAGRLYDRLVRRYGSDAVFMDFYSLEVGDAWSDEIQAHIAKSDAVLVLIGPRWLDATDEDGKRRIDDPGDYLRLEIESALAKGVRIFPVLVEGGNIPDAELLPPSIVGLGHIQGFVLESRDYDEDVERLFAFLDAAQTEAGVTRPGHGRVIPAFVGFTVAEPPGVTGPVLVANWTEFTRSFGGEADGLLLPLAVRGFFDNGGEACYIVRIPLENAEDESRRARVRDFAGDSTVRSGLAGLAALDDVTVVACPDLATAARDDDGRIDLGFWRSVQLHMIDVCEMFENRFALLDTPPDMTPEQVREWRNEVGYDSPRAALYYPWVVAVNSDGDDVPVPPSGHVAGCWQRSDAERGIWHAPADLVVRGALDLERQVTRAEQPLLGTIGINAIRGFGARGIRVWGARTLSSDASFVHLGETRLRSFVHAEVRERTEWAAFEARTPSLWARLADDVDSFLNALWREGALGGDSAGEGYWVKVDEELNPPEVVDQGHVVIEFGYQTTFGGFHRLRVARGWPDTFQPT